MSENAEKNLQSVRLVERQEIMVSGISSVDSFDESRICATCNDGVLVVIEGVGLSVKEVNLERCYFEAAGDITGFFYDSVKSVRKGGFLRNLFVGK